MRWIAAFALLATPALADSAWVQPVAGGYEARIVTEATSCPVLKDAARETPMTVRASASDKFPLVCGAPLAPGVQASINGVPLPAPMVAPKRILVLGDTGCRIKGGTVQECNDAAKWPFPQLAAAAAKLKPDLIVHVGDYLYRESACPPGNAGCAGSPWGDNWTTWQADFFTPAAPLLAAAPVLLARGNHEDCNRAGAGWQLLMGPGAPTPCAAHVPLYTVALHGLVLGVLDDAVSGETDLDRDMAKTYAAEINSLAGPQPAWFIHHRPTWAAITGPLGIPVGGNMTLMQAALDNQAEGKPMLPANVELQLSGHIHSFEALNYEGHVPPQIVAGNGGDNLDVTPKNLRGAAFIGHSGVRVADGLSVGGFGFLLMTRVKTGWTVDLYDSDGRQTRQCRFRDGVKRRVDCPTK
jgi:hypothetical protein